MRRTSQVQLVVKREGGMYGLWMSLGGLTLFVGLYLSAGLLGSGGSVSHHGLSRPWLADLRRRDPFRW